MTTHHCVQTKADGVQRTKFIYASGSCIEKGFGQTHHSHDTYTICLNALCVCRCFVKLQCGHNLWVVCGVYVFTFPEQNAHKNTRGKCV